MSLSFGRYNASQLELPRVNIILFEDLAQEVQTQLYEPTSLIHVVFIITPRLGFNYDTLVSDNVIVPMTTKIRSPFHAVTDWIYCPEPPGSPRPQATGCPGVLGSKSSQLLHGRDFLILFHHFYSCKYSYFRF